MLEGIFEINSYEIDDLLSNINTTSNEVEVANDEAKEDFEAYKKSEVFGKGAQIINDQVDAIFDSLESLGNVMYKGTSTIFETEMKILQEARDLEIPMGYEVNNTVTDKNAGGISLTKNDGRSVNEGENPSEITPEMEEEVEKEELENIEKAETERQEMDENEIRVNEVSLGNIENGETRREEYRDEYTENEQQLGRMEEKEAGEIRDEVEINETEKTALEGMETGNKGTEEQEIKFNEEGIQELGQDNIGI